MRRTLVLFFATLLAATHVLAQGKGIDQPNERVRDTGSNRQPANNGAKQDTGSGRGFDFGKKGASRASLIPNPYTFTARTDALQKAVVAVMHDRKLVLDETASKPGQGIFISQPYTFIKGAVVSESELNHYADVQSMTARGWTRGRYTMIVEIQPIDGVRANVSVNAKVEGRTDGASGAEWMTLRSSGAAEQDLLSALIENVTGAPPPGHPTSNP